MTVIGNACLADGLANQLFTSLTDDAPVAPSVDFTDPKFSFASNVSSELYKDLDSITLEQLTEGSLEGEGVFDKLMGAVDIHIKREFKDNRITGAEYAEVYTAVMSGVLSQSTQFLLQKDQAKWAAITAQMQARVAEIQATVALVELEKAKVDAQKSIFDMKNSGAEYALTKMQIANADAQYCGTKAATEIAQYQLASMLPAELASVQARTLGTISETSASDYNVANILPQALLRSVAEVAQVNLTVSDVIPGQVSKTAAEKLGVDEDNLHTVSLRLGTEASTESEKYKRNWLMPADLAIQEYQRSNIMPIEYAAKQVTADRILPSEASIKEFENRVLQPIEQGIQNFQLQSTLPLQQASGQYQLTNLLPVQLGKEQHLLNFQLPAQTALITEQKEVQRSQTLDNRSDALTPISGLVGKQKDSIVQDIASKLFNVDFVLPIQLDLVKEQREAERAKTMDDRSDASTAISGLLGRQSNLLEEQREVERAKTLNTRTDGSTVVAGSVGKQKELYDQQIDSFIKDSKQKAAKMWLDGWTVQKTLNESLASPNELDVPSVSAVLLSLRNENGL